MGSPTTGRAGIGVRLQVAIAGVLTDVANVASMSVGGVTLNMIDATHLGSSGFYQEFLPGLKAAEEWTMSIHFDPSHVTQSQAFGFAKLLEERELTVLRVDPSAIGLNLGLQVEAYVSSLGNIDFNPEAVMARQINVRPTGPVSAIDVSTPPAGLNFSSPANSGYLALI